MLNAIRTSFLLAALSALFMGVGYVVGGTPGMIIALGFAVATNMFAYWNADKLVLRMQNAEELPASRAPQLHAIVADLAARAGLPMPRIYLIHADQPNAFATGRDPQNAAVAVSTGLLQTLEPRELAGVLAHELAHVRNRDTLTMAITATLAGAISMLAQFGFFFGGFGRNSNSPFGPFGGLLAMIFAPLAAMLVQMAVSRTREYQADKTGAMISGDPLALASALEKISGRARRTGDSLARQNPAMAHMFIVNPLAGDRMDNLFATHPDVNNRIAQLQAIAAQMDRPDPVGATGSAPTHRDGNARRPGPARHAEGSAGWRVPSAGSQTHSEPRGPWG